MKKILLFIFLILVCGGCCKSTYEIHYVDSKAPTDTLSAAIRLNERLWFRGEDITIRVVAKNVGNTEFPLFVNYLRADGFSGGAIIHSSTSPITIIDVEYKLGNKQ